MFKSSGLDYKTLELQLGTANLDKDCFVIQGVWPAPFLPSLVDFSYINTFLLSS